MDGDDRPRNAEKVGNPESGTLNLCIEEADALCSRYHTVRSAFVPIRVEAFPRLEYIMKSSIPAGNTREEEM